MSQHKKEADKQKEIEESIVSDAPLSPAEEKAAAKERGKPKEYSIDTFKRPLKDDKERGITELSDFKKLDEVDQKKFIINRWIQENRTLDKSEMHEVSLDDEKLVGLVPS